LIGFACLRSGEKGAPLEVSKFRWWGDEAIATFNNENRPIGLGAYFAYQVGILVLNYLVHMPLVFIMEFVLFTLWYFLASMHLLREGQMGWRFFGVIILHLL
jgi:hypothetical protein